jgi:hypothetical protein
MFNNLYKVLSGILIAVFCFSTVKGQDNCAITLKNAQKTYDDGAIEKVAELLQPCLEKGFSKEEKTQAYRLLILTYLFENNRTEAEKYMEKLLRLEPEFQVNSAVDPPEFVKLIESYRTLPLYSIGGILGGNFSFTKITTEYFLDDLNNSAAKYSPKFGFQGSFIATRYLFDKCELRLEVLGILNKFNYTNTVLSNSKVDLTETQLWLRPSLSGTYDFKLNKKLTAYARAGFAFGLLMNDKAKVTRTYSDAAHNKVEGADVDLLDKKKVDGTVNSQRNQYNYWIVAGGGIKYKIKKGSLFFDLQYHLGISNQVKSQERYSNKELNYAYYYVDSDFQVSNLLFSLGYSHSIYNPKKKKEKQTTN